MAIYRTPEKIPYSFLKDAILTIDNFVEGFTKIYMDPTGECAITYKGILSLMDITYIINQLDPYSDKKVTILDYSNTPKESTDYEYFENSTTIYTKDGIDYRKL